jgi:hypothetical protein
LEGSVRITRSYVRNLDLYVHRELKDQFVRVIADFEGLNGRGYERIGLDGPLAEGESYLPPPVGRASRFNSEGKWTPQRDQPKELRYVRTIYWKWKQWSGRDVEEMEDSRDIYRLCYPRQFISPPAEEVFGFPVDGKIHAATEAVSLPGSADQLLHQINLMLDLFRYCEVVRADGTSASPATTHRRWVFLPSGPYKKGDVTRAITSVLERLGDSDRIILSERQDFLTELEPQEVAQGQGGFNDYLAYVFPQYGRVVLESLRRDNAIYVFKGQWERFSRLSKREILDSGVHDARVLHTKGWQDRLLDVLRSG